MGLVLLGYITYLSHKMILWNINLGSRGLFSEINFWFKSFIPYFCFEKLWFSHLSKDNLLPFKILVYKKTFREITLLRSKKRYSWFFVFFWFLGLIQTLFFYWDNIQGFSKLLWYRYGILNVQSKFWWND
jgi:hypothetical protein